MKEPNGNWIRVASVPEVREKGCLQVQANGHSVALFAYADKIYAVDNRCPHMGFPLDRGTVQDGILTCYWHYARFDLASGGTFDQWADDVATFPVRQHEDEVWLDIAPRGERGAHYRERLQVGLEQNLPLVIAKATLALVDQDGDPVQPFRAGLQFGSQYRAAGWGQGLTILTCMMNLVPYLEEAERPRALYHGLAAVAVDSAGSAPRFPVRPLPGETRDLQKLKRWFRRFVEVRDAEGAERCLISAVRTGASGHEMADMLFAAVTDHRYLDNGHLADFTNKALEALDVAGWDLAESVLGSLVQGYANASRMEESNAWRNPVDLVALLQGAFERLPKVVAEGRLQTREVPNGSKLQEELLDTLLGDEPEHTVRRMLAALQTGMLPKVLAAHVSYAAALRIARFHTSNEFGDWDTALHTFSFANAIEQAIRRTPSVELLRGVFDAAMSVYLDRFLNIPPARLPRPNGHDQGLETLATLLDRQQQVNEAGGQVAAYLYAGWPVEPLLAQLGHLLLREDRNFHTIQAVEAAVRQFGHRQADPEAVQILVAAARYLAAHAPTMRAQEQTFSIARRLQRGERLFEG